MLPTSAPPTDIRHLWHAMLGCMRSVKAEARFGPIHGLSPLETETLDQVAEHPDLILRELSAALQVPKSTLTSLLDRMERQGLLVRTLSVRDRRSYGLALTDPGRLAQQTHLDFEAAAWSRALRPLSDSQRATFLDLLTAMVRGFPDPPKGPAHE